MQKSARYFGKALDFFRKTRHILGKSVKGLKILTKKRQEKALGARKNFSRQADQKALDLALFSARWQPCVCRNRVNVTGDGDWCFVHPPLGRSGARFTSLNPRVITIENKNLFCKLSSVNRTIFYHNLTKQRVRKIRTHN